METQLSMSSHAGDKNFDVQNLFRNRKKVAIYLRNEGNTLKALKKMPSVDDFHADLVKSLLSLVHFLGTNNLIHYDVKPANVCFQTADTLSKSDLNESDQSQQNYVPRWVIKKYDWSVPQEPDLRSHARRDASSLSRYSKKSSSGFRKPTEIGSSKHRLNRTRNKSASNRCRFGLNPSGTGRQTITIQFRQTGKLRLKLIDFGLAKHQNLAIISYRIRCVLKKLKAHVAKSDLALDMELVDEHFDLHQELASRFDLHSSRSPKAKYQTETRFAMLDVGTEQDLGLYTKRINTVHHQSESGLPDKAFSPKSQFSTGLNRLDSEEQFKPSLRDRFFGLIRKLTTPEPSALTAEYKSQLRTAQTKIQKMSVRGTVKFAGILSMLKIDCHFLADVESTLYTLLDVMKLLPKRPVQPRRQFGKFRSELFEADRQVGIGRTDDLSEFATRTTFFSHAEVDILLAVLVILHQDDFNRVEAGIAWLFELSQSYRIGPARRAKKKSRQRQKTQVNTDQHRLDRLRMLVDKVNRVRPERLFEVFNLRRPVLENLLTKLSLHVAEQFKAFPESMRKLFRVVKKALFHWLVCVMFSSKYHFLHKFCLVAMIKSSQSA